MSGSSSIRDTFFQECEDLIDALTDGLNEMADGETDDETVNAVFRAVHSIKGAAGAFALTDLVGFAHKFETVLDGVRSHVITPDAALMRVLQRAGDILADLVDAARTEGEINQDAVDTTLASLQEFLGDEAEEEAQEVEFVFEPVVIAVADDAPTDEQIGFTIALKPTTELYAMGHEPLFMLTELEELGTMTVTADLSALPPSLDDFDWEESRLTWSIALETDASEQRILQIFEFAEGLLAVDVQPLFSDGAAPAISAPQLNLAPEPIVETAVELAPAEPEVADTPAPAPKTEAAPSKAKPASADKGPRATLRVDLERVDRLINAVGELIINQSVIAQRIEKSGISTADEVLLDLEDYKLLAREIQEGVMAIRAQPVKPLFQRMSRIAREASEATGKLIQLVTEGEETEVDKTVVERLADPLTHMIRNAIDHGIESRADRKAAGKQEEGVIRLKAQHRSGSVLIEISDDGAGLNRDRIRATAIKRGIIGPDAELNSAEIDNLLFAPGFSTAAEVTNLSGRGVGMDVVKTAITALGGRVSISSVHGEGTTFSIALPLTLAVMDGMIITVGEQTMVVPISSILETIRPTAADVSKIGLNGPLLSIRGTYVPVIDLQESLGQPRREMDLTEQVLLVVRTEQMKQCALAVDAIWDQRQVVIKSLAGNYGSIPGVSAATILGDGKIALILDPDAIAATLTARPMKNGENTIEKELQHV